MASSNPLAPLTETKDTADIIGSFLKAPELASLCQSSKNTQLLFSKRLPAMELLKAVFDADPKRVKEILAKPHPSYSRDHHIVIQKTHIKETYFSRKLGITGVKKQWLNFSPLEAAAMCGDIFLVRLLLLYVPPNQRHEALSQLKGILDRKKSEIIDDKGRPCFLFPYKCLISAYKDYLDQYVDLIDEKNIQELNKLLNEIWQRQRSLPTYALQEFCDDKPFHPVPSFDEEPKRSCHLWGIPLDLDNMPYGSALYKSNLCKQKIFQDLGPGLGHFIVTAFYINHFLHGNWIDSRVRGVYTDLLEDFRAINQFCRVREADLENIIKQLENQIPLNIEDLEESELRKMHDEAHEKIETRKKIKSDHGS